MSGTDRQFCPEGHWLASRGSAQGTDLSISSEYLKLKIDSFSCTPIGADTYINSISLQMRPSFT